MSDLPRALAIRGGTVATAADTTGWPVAAIVRGRVVSEGGRPAAGPGGGLSLARGASGRRDGDAAP